MLENGKKQQGLITGILFPMGLICLFAFCSLALALLGGSAYKKIQSGIDDSFGSTVTANYLRTKLSQNNVVGAVSLRGIEEDSMLIISLDVDKRSYETRIFVHDGILKETFLPANQPHVPTEGLSIAEVSTCAFSLDSYGLFIAEIESPMGVRTRTAIALVEGSTL